MNDKRPANERSAARDPVTSKVLPEAIDPAREDDYWRNNYSKRPYVTRVSTYEDYGPAYGFGVDAATRYPGRPFDEIEPEMSNDWTTAGGLSMLGWNNARHAARDAWNRVNGHGNPNG